MRAIVCTKYGTPDVLQLKEVEKPVPKDNQVLVKVHAASINSWDWDMLRGRPYIVRMWGLLKPRYRIPGADIAGRVEAAGRKVTKFQPGDEVFGDLCAAGWGGYAEYVCAPENTLALKPAGMTFAQAAAIPQAGVMALQSIRDKAQCRPGQKVLINGGGGGVGTFAIQMAGSAGAEVTGVDSAQKLDTMRSAGAAHVIDYRQEDFTNSGQRYDVIIDVVANRSIFAYKRALNPGGTFVMIGGTGSAIIQAMLLAPCVSMTGSKKLGILAHQPNKDLAFISTLFETGKVVPVVDSCYPLHDTAGAFRHFGAGLARGKVIITM